MLSVLTYRFLDVTSSLTFLPHPGPHHRQRLGNNHESDASHVQIPLSPQPILPYYTYGVIAYSESGNY